MKFEELKKEFVNDFVLKKNDDTKAKTINGMAITFRTMKALKLVRQSYNLDEVAQQEI
jgi:hypothetical protein